MREISLYPLVPLRCDFFSARQIFLSMTWNHGDVAILNPHWGTGIESNRALDPAHATSLIDAFAKEGVGRFETKHRILAMFEKEGSNEPRGAQLHCKRPLSNQLQGRCR
ncbi:hypothetical protein DTO280E4_8351 [Paecilomyces variotii]|nr:hypothetical protein DTO169E5_5321 [Paecilomyces variotii]KAJ9261112.1 hypothetical protein DTO207G8_262 [Paecilomyces variotii]KAJ9351016.1 hypothetical protein DTO027B9_6601 [Paecilomyces variotii]KAJ9351205.1 hypothetical protein DTO280E4_8351 [Paecilomyces variotii]KAJ9393007.1 hypothetical protein DTO063F5_144 [Paecilomyces variotii]